LKRDLESSWAQTLADLVASQAWCFVYIYFFILKMEKKKTLDVRIPNMNLVPKWAFLGLKLKKKVDLENEAHFEVCFQIYPSMLENCTGV
jgi:hypothetical protein